MHPWFCFPVWYSFEFRNDTTGWFGNFVPSFFVFLFRWFWFPTSSTAMNSRGCGLSVYALCCFCHISSSHSSELTWCCTMPPTTLFFPPNDIFSHFNSTSPCRMHLLYTLTKHIFSECICCFLFTFVAFVCYWNVTTVGESMLENVIR